MSNSEKNVHRDHQRGALLGLAVGDALGAAVEFQMPGGFEPVVGYRGGGLHALEPGEWTGPGKPIVEISGDGKLELKVEAPETAVSGLREGAVVFAELPFANGSRIKGRLKSVARASTGPGL